MVRYLVDLINMFRGPEQEPFAFNKIQFWLVYSGEPASQGRQAGQAGSSG